MAEHEEDYSMILVMGVTGSGKSHLINRLAKGSVMEGHGLRSKTQKCKVVKLKVGSRYVAVVDTPGFDDSTRTDADILDEIVQFLVLQYELGIPLKGIVYLHRITDNKMSGTAQRYFEMFQRICGDSNLGNVVLLTTMWDQLKDEGVGLRRDQELRDEFWTMMESKGSQIRKYDGSEAMAEAIICRLMRKRNIVLDIQRELVDEGKMLEETTAGQLLIPRLEQRMKEDEAELAALDDNINRTPNVRRSKLEEQRQSVWAQRQQDIKSRERLKKRPAQEMKDTVEEAKQGKWSGRIHAFASVLGLAMSTTFNLILPLAGVVLGG